MQDRIFELIVDRNEVSWKSIIYDLVNSEQIDPWDVDVSLLTQRYIARLHELKGMDLKLSGKVLLAAAVLLRIKSKRLVGEDVEGFDRLMAGEHVDAGEFYDELEQELQRGEVLGGNVELFPHVPEPRRRKVSVQDLVRALEQALEVKKRRVWNSVPMSSVVVPAKTWDLGDAVKNVYARIMDFFSRQKNVFFSHLLRSATREEKIFTFLPLLHLASQRKVELVQEVPFGDIEVKQVREVVSGGIEQN